MSLELVFLGSSGCIRIPTFNCTCRVCEEARQDKKLERTRASVALLGKETTIIDASPDLPAQLERERIRKVDKVFLTHWHFDHVWGLAELVEPAFISHWAPVDIYLPELSMHFFEKAMSYMHDAVALHPVNPGDVIETADATCEVVKTNHTPDSVGYIVHSDKSMAYLLDSYIPPLETVKRVSDVDILVLGPLLDRLVLLEGEERWLHFALDEAVDFWKELNVDKCVLSHLSCHSYVEGEIIAGLSASERKEYEGQQDGLTFAYDGLRIQL
jgi:phosphoribosyl 1,2-cyclic phosphate phosphodiesterase